MAEKRGLRGFTRLDALVSGAACLVLVLLVPVLLGKPRERSVRMACAANLAQIGKTTFVYAADYEGVLPRAGGATTRWGMTVNWEAPDRYRAFGLSIADGSGGRATISSCFYLLVKYYEAPTRLFLCRGDKGTKEFRLSGVWGQSVGQFKLSDAWDFGPAATAFKSCSFSYHFPYSQYALTTSRDPNLAVAADRNPWLASPAGAAGNFAEFKPDLPGAGAAVTAEMGRKGNAISHGLDGQNVLFLDGRVTFETRSFCGVGQDNIYTVGTGSIDRGSPMGTIPTVALAKPANQMDSILVHDVSVDGAGEAVKR